MCALFAHNFNIHFSPPSDGYDNGLTVHACTVAKISTVFYYWDLFLQPVWCLWVPKWSIKGSFLPEQADSWPGVTTLLAGDTGHGFSYVLWYMGLKMAWINAIWPYKNFWIGTPYHFVASHHPSLSIHVRVLVVLTALCLAIHLRVDPLNYHKWL